MRVGRKELITFIRAVKKTMSTEPSAAHTTQIPSTQGGQRPIDALLASYSVGALDPATHALIASHLLLSSRNRRFVAALEDLAAGELESVAPAKLHDRDQRLARIFDGAAPLDPPVRPVGASSVLPAPLLRLVGGDVGDIKWRSKLPGVREHRISGNERGEASLLWIGGGRSVPSHTHEGSEITLVLKGSFSDVTGRYERGDVAIVEPDFDHRPKTNVGEDCICFAVTDAPLHLTGPVGRILDRLFGHRR